MLYCNNDQIHFNVFYYQKMQIRHFSFCTTVKKCKTGNVDVSLLRCLPLDTVVSGVVYVKNPLAVQNTQK